MSSRQGATRVPSNELDLRELDLRELDSRELDLRERDLRELESVRMQGTASRLLVRRTQRSVRNEVMAGQERRRQGRSAVGISGLIFAVVLLLLTPAVWTGFNQWVSWEHFSDAEGQSTYLMLWLLPAALALLVAALVKQGGLSGRRGQR